MKDEIYSLKPEDFPSLLSEITDPPKTLYYRGTLPNWDSYKFLTVVGSRKYSEYGKKACQKLIAGLRNYPIVIISGLAIGIDAIAHEAALENNLTTIAVPGSGIRDDVLYPRYNSILAKKIIKAGGLVMSEFEPDTKAALWTFPKRNRIMAGLSHAILLVEAEEKSGTLITGRLAMEYNRDVLAVPGSIFSPSSRGTNRFLQDGARIITKSEDILHILGFEENENQKQLPDSLSPDEKIILETLIDGSTKDDLCASLQKDPSDVLMILSLLEIKGFIKEELGVIRKLV